MMRATASKQEWISVNTSEFNLSKGVNKDVIEFIANVLYHSGTEESNVTRRLFEAGYCYYFALMLKDAFGRGRLCYAYPFGHIVWEDVNGVSYDINGPYRADDYLFDISDLGDGIKDFKHVPNETSGMSTVDICNLLNRLVYERKHENNSLENSIRKLGELQ